MVREAAPFASRKCRVYKVSLAEANGTIVLGAVLSRGVLLAHPLAFIRSCIVASLSDLCIHHLPLDSCVLLVHPFALLSVSFLLALSLSHLRATSFLLIYRSFWYSRRFHRNATVRERRTMEDRDFSAAGRAKGCDLRMEI